MPSKVFISWSGDLSKKLAEEIRVWLPAVLQFVRPYFTPNDIEKGTRWSNEISSELESSNAGIICLTKDNLSNPWILFESGALSKNFGKANVCTVLFNLDSADLTGPLTCFQATKFEKNDFKKLLVAINTTGGDVKLESAVLNDVFDMWWPKLESKIKNILDSNVTKNNTKVREEREILEEILELTRMNARKVPRRNDGLREHLYRIIVVLQDLQANLIEHGDKNSLMIYEDLRTPIKRICMEMDATELYERFILLYNRTSYVLEKGGVKPAKVR